MRHKNEISKVLSTIELFQQFGTWSIDDFLEFVEAWTAEAELDRQYAPAHVSLMWSLYAHGIDAEWDCEKTSYVLDQIVWIEMLYTIWSPQSTVWCTAIALDRSLHYELRAEGLRFFLSRLEKSNVPIPAAISEEIDHVLRAMPTGRRDMFAQDWSITI